MKQYLCTRQETDKLVREVMRFLIFRQSAKPGVPVPRGDISKITATQRRANGSYIIQLAQERFSRCMGLELKEIKVPSEKDIKQGLGALTVLVTYTYSS